MSWLFGIKPASPPKFADLCKNTPENTKNPNFIVPEHGHNANTFAFVACSLELLDSCAYRYHYTNVIVHFDLKGAPPKTQYFLELLKLVAKSGAT
ncbi:hypothetical protein OSTOST_25779, partial [Ostertagia ostertagi]